MYSRTFSVDALAGLLVDRWTKGDWTLMHATRLKVGLPILSTYKDCLVSPGHPIHFASYIAQ